MKIHAIVLKLLFSLGILFCLSGCLISAQGNRAKVVIADDVPSHTGAHKSGPPAHAKAHGHRAKYRYHYYPNSGVYFDTGRSVYFYLDSSGAWRMTVSLPQSLSVHLGNNVTIEMDTDRPYTHYHEHKKKYPGKKSKKSKWD
ncbi:MAG: hypothetical protein OQK50_02470 [Deltaproteobacteria bacterium]|jgi:hypothetical protein|nr:hypothetical protein [Deltaproteobacteria bacterium]MCW8893035.1 hypothetical protein [Deltaproteobacteria bacterium]MCW9049180.1 hypothetical protein [Deltaproteobacteria bacterium]